MKKKHFFTILMIGVSLNSLAQEADGEIGGHEYIDLGLPSKTLWATHNVGSTSPYDGGDFFAWGETKPKSLFDWGNYRYYQGMTEYPGGEWYEDVEDIGDDICGTEYDAARVMWGDGWRLPDDKDLRELWAYCIRDEWVTEEGVTGVRIYGRNGHSIFLPACGFGKTTDSSLDQLIGYVGPYWTGISSPFRTYMGIPIEPSPYAKIFYIDLSGFVVGDRNLKYGGLHIRPVISRKDIGLGVGLTDDNLDVSLRYGQGKLSIMGNLDGCTVRVSDISGRILLQCAAQSEIYLSILTPGIYTATLHKDSSMVTALKIVVR